MVEKKKTSKTHKNSKASAKTILVIDDDSTVCEVMNAMLGLKGFAVLMAFNGVDGLKMCADHPVDLIILDLNMPRMDGYMFLEHLRNRWANENIQRPFPAIIVLSGVDRQEDLGLSTSLGAASFIQKPFDPDDLYKTVNNALGI
jgi:two-component system chemotaxis response regulator CheY